MHQVLWKEMTTIKFHNKRTIAIPFGSHGGFSRGRLFTFQRHGSARYHWLTYVKYQIQRKTSKHVICYTITSYQFVGLSSSPWWPKEKTRYGTRKKLWYNPQNFEGCTITFGLYHNTCKEILLHEFNPQKMFQAKWKVVAMAAMAMSKNDIQHTSGWWSAARC